MLCRATLTLGLILALGSPAEAATVRSRTVLREWRLNHSCPSTGLKTGPCPGWQADHLAALCWSRLDRPGNLHWMTVADHRAKTKLDIKGCRILRHKP